MLLKEVLNLLEVINLNDLQAGTVSASRFTDASPIIFMIFLYGFLAVISAASVKILRNNWKATENAIYSKNKTF
ncbi:hypothetical protein [Methanosarcina sp. KYL-1]|uniref:hypothetical protein n=1 Tax=Methanosarcina sp. KYL-1 TaxID=2602068 RepID=UPI0021008926|nr:hypothetical protein [Methanosarcina sp. KYL-1]